MGSTTTMFVTDADNREVLEYDGTSGTIGKWYSFAPAAAMGPDAVLNEMDVAAGTRQTMIPDEQGSVAAALASGGGLTKFGYQTFGEHPSLAAGSFRYTARRYDAETAGSAAQPSGLYYYRARMYSPTWGRFLEPDPIGYAGGSNLYAYVGNDPLNLTDPSGEQALPGFFIGAISGGIAGYIAGGSEGAFIGAAVGGVVGIAAPEFSGAVDRTVLVATRSVPVAAGFGATTFSLVNAGGGTAAAIATNLAEGLPTFSNVKAAAIVGGAAPLLSGEAVLAGLGGGAAAGVTELANPALAVQTAIFGVLGAVAIAPNALRAPPTTLFPGPSTAAPSPTLQPAATVNTGK